ncbi:hypothetical protein IAT40_002001 [Kwoniella sp. CBS 6097]
MEHVEKLQEAIDASDDERVSSTLDELAVKLRDASIREPLGESRLPGLLADLAKSTDHEILRQTGRVAANLIIDTDINRSKLVETGYIDAVLALSPSPLGASVTLPIVASLHNLVVDGHEPSLASLKQPLNTRAIQSLTQYWTESFYDQKSTQASETTTITQWLWAILALITTKETSASSELVILPLKGSSNPPADDATHYAILSSACGVIEASESLELVEEILSELLNFIEHANVPARSGSGSGSASADQEAGKPKGVDEESGKSDKDKQAAEEEEEEKEDDDETDEGEEEEEEGEDFGKVLGSSKGAIIRSLVSHSSDIPSSSLYWTRMREWLRAGSERADLLNCALLSFGNSIHDDESATNLLPTILPTLLPLMKPSTPGTTQHSLIGLLKNLSIPAPNKIRLGDAGVVGKLYEMRVFDEERDLLGSVQGGAAGILKNLCKGNVINTQRLLSVSVSPNKTDRDDSQDHHQIHAKQTSSLDPILAMIKRTDDQAIRFECTRVFVNIIKSLAAAQQPIPTAQLWPTIQPLVDMFKDAGEYPVLQQEAVIALTLLATFTPDSKSTISQALEPHLQILQSMAQNDRREIRENASTLLRQIEHA